MSTPISKPRQHPTVTDAIISLKEIADHPSQFSLSETTIAISNAIYFLELYCKDSDR